MRAFPLLRAPCPSWQGWKITRPPPFPFVNTKWKPAPPGIRVSFAKNTAHTRLIHILFMGRATGTVPFRLLFASRPPRRFASPLFPPILRPVVMFRDNNARHVSTSFSRISRCFIIQIEPGGGDENSFNGFRRRKISRVFTRLSGDIFHAGKIFRLKFNYFLASK